mmetsp:Transcript_12841/g.49186  ORF Transcript_12841/g.49186 Transcript_12841/m.49186 type:complete len:221 (-) Transcript_12841:346-1008(-)
MKSLRACRSTRSLRLFFLRLLCVPGSAEPSAPPSSRGRFCAVRPEDELPDAASSADVAASRACLLASARLCISKRRCFPTAVGADDAAAARRPIFELAWTPSSAASSSSPATPSSSSSSPPTNALSTTSAPPSSAAPVPSFSCSKAASAPKSSSSSNCVKMASSACWAADMSPRSSASSSSTWSMPSCATARSAPWMPLYPSLRFCFPSFLSTSAWNEAL